MHHHLCFGVSPPYRHQQRIQYQFLGDPRLHGPANHTPGEQVYNHSSIQPTLMGADLRDICHPRFIRCGYIELTLQPVWNNNIGWVTSRSWSPVAYLSSEFCYTHQAINPVLTTTFPQLLQIAIDLAVTIDATALQPELLDEPGKPCICNVPLGSRLTQPGVISVGVHDKQIAESANR